MAGVPLMQVAGVHLTPLQQTFTRTNAVLYKKLLVVSYPAPVIKFTNNWKEQQDGGR
jgi:hypothetical protein